MRHKSVGVGVEEVFSPIISYEWIMALRGERRGGWTKFEIAQEKFSFQCKKIDSYPSKI